MSPVDPCAKEEVEVSWIHALLGPSSSFDPMVMFDGVVGAYMKLTKGAFWSVRLVRKTDMEAVQYAKLIWLPSPDGTEGGWWLEFRSLAGLERADEIRTLTSKARRPPSGVVLPPHVHKWVLKEVGIYGWH